MEASRFREFLYISSQIVSRESVDCDDLAPRKSKLAQQKLDAMMGHREKNSSRNISIFALRRQGLMRLPGEQKIGPKGRADIYDAPQPFTELTAKTEDGVIRLNRVTPSSFKFLSY